MTHNDVIHEEWSTDRTLKSLKGKMTPKREGVIKVLNQKRRKEGIYARRRISKK